MKQTLTLLTLLLLASPGIAQQRQAPPRAACVLLAFDGMGDFGPQTPGTRTDGWQEALDFCVRQARDLHALGGFGGRKPVYHIRDTIRFPAAQDFRVTGGVYVLNWEGPADKTCEQGKPAGHADKNSIQPDKAAFIGNSFALPPAGGPTKAGGEQAYFSMLWNPGPHALRSAHYGVADLQPVPNGPHSVSVVADQNFHDWNVIQPGTTRMRVR